MPNEYELKPQYDARKSFYGKARVRVDDDGNRFLISYGRPVAWIEKSTGSFHRLWYGWSATTGRHVAEFCRQFTPCGERPGAACKKEWDKMEVEELPHPL